jgi:hypothetical protein
MLVRIRGKLRRAQGRIFSQLEIEILEYDRLFDITHDVLNHSRALSHFGLDITETFNSTTTVVNKIVDSKTA